ncbi:MAG TPA: XdhC/CoxI family protein [Thermoanaerobaculia bacterium]|nr:XdhC/CoxI family protein [Thermoanaerobaculia bacterium]
MRDVLDDIERWRSEGKRVALATVVATWGSAPRAVGGKMAVAEGRQIAGSVSGGCVENAVAEAAGEVLRSGRPRLLKFGVSDDTAWSVGLACGGAIEVFVEPLADAAYGLVRDAVRAERSVAITTVIQGPAEHVGRKLVLTADGRTAGDLGNPIDRETRNALTDGRSRRVSIGEDEVFVDVLLPSPRLVVVGGVHIAVALVKLASALGWRTVLVDPREAFGNRARFPGVDEILSEWPDAALGRLALNENTAVAILTHDPKLDDPAVTAALASPAFYVGALGSTRTQEKRRKRLLEAGVSEEGLARLHAPIGLDLGGRAPEEIALSVMAQIVAVRHGKASAA